MALTGVVEEHSWLKIWPVKQAVSNTAIHSKLTVNAHKKLCSVERQRGKVANIEKWSCRPSSFLTRTVTLMAVTMEIKTS